MAKIDHFAHFFSFLLRLQQFFKIVSYETIFMTVDSEVFQRHPEILFSQSHDSNSTFRTILTERKSALLVKFETWLCDGRFCRHFRSIPESTVMKSVNEKVLTEKCCNFNKKCAKPKDG